MQALSPLDVDAELRTDHLIKDVGIRSLRGGALSFSAQAAKIVLQIATVIVLTRLLSPSAFGLIAMVAAINAVLEIVRELGLSAATIRKPDLTHAQVSSLFWINASAGSAGALLLYLAAPAIAAFYRQPELVWVARALALVFVMTALSVQHWSLLRRQMRFGPVVTVDIGAEVTGFVLAIAFAFAGFGYWALIAQRLGSALFAMLACWSFCRWRPGPPKLADGTGELVRFGAAVTGVNIAAALSRNIDQVLIGWMWGAAPLGLYDRSSRLMMAPINNFGPPMYAVAMPAFSRIADQPERYCRGFIGVLEKVAIIAMPLAAILALSAPWIVTLLFGERWIAATPLVAFFSAAIVYQPLMQMTGMLFITQDRAREGLRAALIDGALCVGAVIAAVRFGPNWVAATIAASGIVVRLPIQFALGGARGPVGFRDLLGAALPGAAGAVAAALAVGLMRSLVLPDDIPAVFALATNAAIGFAAALIVYLAIPRSRRTLFAFRTLFRRLKDTRAARPVAVGS